MCLAFLSKYILFFVNLIFVLAGAALLASGILVLVNVNEIVELIPVNISLIPITVIVFGAIIFFIAFFGCCGAITENRCYLVMYAVCMLVLAAVKIWFAVVLFQNLNNLQSLVEGWLEDSFKSETAFVPLEVAFRCCGTTGQGSYIANGWNVTLTCCENQIIVDGACQSYYSGCSDRLGGYFNTSGTYIAYGLIGVIVVELVAVILSLYLNHNITKKDRAKYY